MNEPKQKPIPEVNRMSHRRRRASQLHSDLWSQGFRIRYNFRSMKLEVKSDIGAKLSLNLKNRVVALRPEMISLCIWLGETKR